MKKRFAILFSIITILALAGCSLTTRVQPPKFSQQSGTYDHSFELILTAPKDTEIRYTTDGTEPSMTSPCYKDPITVDSPTVIKAFVVRNWNLFSEVVTREYDFQPMAPEITPASGSYGMGQTVTITTSTEGADIHFTTDGLDPTTASPLYSAPFEIPGGKPTIKAIATHSDWTPSAITVATYGTRSAAPVILPASGTFSASQTVSIAAEDPSIVIRYTTDGTDPCDDSPVYQGAFTVDANATVRAIAQRPNYLDSDIVSASYTFKTVAPVILPDEGETYVAGQRVTLSCSTEGASIYYTTDGTIPSLSGTRYTAPFEIPSDSTTVRAIAVCEGWDDSDVSVATFRVKAAAPAFSITSGEYGEKQTVSISGNSGATVYYTTDGTDPDGSGSKAEGPIEVKANTTIKAVSYQIGFLPSDVVTANYTFKAEQPTISPDPSRTYIAGQSVTLSCVTKGASIYYTTDGTLPSLSGTRYTAPFEIPADSTTVRAIAVCEGWTDSNVSAATYRVRSVAPTFSSEGGSYSNTLQVFVQNSVGSSTSYYTRDGSEPTTSSPIANYPIEVKTDTTLKAISVQPGFLPSDVVVADYTFRAEQPTISPDPSLTYIAGQNVTLSCGTEDATIFYTTDGSQPTVSSTLYSGPFNIPSDSAKIKAFAVYSDWRASATASATYRVRSVAPTFSIPEGNYTETIQVFVQNTESSSTSYYTRDGSEPTTSSPIANYPIEVKTDTTLKAISVQPGFLPSDVTTAAYVFK